MRIVELGDYSMVIMKDSNDSFYHSVGNYYRMAKRNNYNMEVISARGRSPHSTDAVCTAGRLVLFFKDKVSDIFKIQDKVEIVFVCD
jgi:hypothetical protein